LENSARWFERRKTEYRIQEFRSAAKPRKVNGERDALGEIVTGQMKKDRRGKTQ
jgi:hypothetical protein